MLRRVSTFWQGKKVLLTGHTGFKGSWLSLWLQQAGAELVGYSLPPPTEPSLFELAGVGEGMASIFGDIRDLRRLKAVFDQHRPAVVLHLAAQAIVRASYDDPVETYSTNVMGTVGVLEAVRASPGVRVVVAVTSDKCYDNREIERGYVEGDPLGGRDPLFEQQRVRRAGGASLPRILPGLRRTAGGVGDRPSRQRRRRWRLGQGSPGARHHALCHRPPDASHPQSQGDPALAARPGSARRLPDARRAAVERRPALQ